MNKSIQLPVSTPRFSTYNFLGCAGVAAAASPWLDNWYFNNCIQIKCTRKYLWENWPLYLSLSKGCVEDMPFFLKDSIKFNIARYSYHEIVKDYLNEGYYVMFNGVDNFYVEGKSGYGISHHSHDGMMMIKRLIQ